MSLAIVYTRARDGINAPQVTIEVHLSNGLPGFNIVGLAEASVREAKDRVRSALVNSQFEFPMRRITVNMSPADLPKIGNHYDLAIAIGILAASGQLPNKSLEHYEFYGELALSGALRHISCSIPFALACHEANRQNFMPVKAAAEAGLVAPDSTFAAESLQAIFSHLLGQQRLTFCQPTTTSQYKDEHLDMGDIIGQQTAKRALEIAACGNHNILFVGPPGTGKTMLASRLPSILPPMTDQEALEVAAISSVCQRELDPANWHTRPFRAPHHSASPAALVGGGSQPRPGEITLAHRGVLFLDELPEFDRKVLDMLREPMESGEICISRAASKTDFPAQFQLVAALNPSPTGHHSDKRASIEQVLRYLNRLSGPFLDRIDIHVDVPKISHQYIQNQAPAESSASIRARVQHARQMQLSRCGVPNNEMTNKQIAQFCQLSKANSLFLNDAVNALSLSMRSYHRILKVSRSIADLANEAEIGEAHLAEALSYRAMDRLFQELQC